MTTTKFAADLAVVRQGRILFSHHSVGANIIMGIRRLDTENSGGSHIRVASLEVAAASKGPMLIEYSGGENGWPKSKIDSFSATIRGETRLKPELAFMKFCYADFDPQTDVAEVFNYYRSSIEALKREHPEIRFAHTTVPLTVWPTGVKSRVKRLIGREVWEDMSNVKRAEFNRRLKEYFKSDPIFDISLIEATAPDGQLTTFKLGGQIYPSLYPGYASDDKGHLNTMGQQVAGEAFIRFIAEGLKGRNSSR